MQLRDHGDCGMQQLHLKRRSRECPEVLAMCGVLLCRQLLKPQAPNTLIPATLKPERVKSIPQLSESGENGTVVFQLISRDARSPRFFGLIYEQAATQRGKNPGRTANKIRSHLRAVMSWAWEQDMIELLPRFPKPKGQRDGQCCNKLDFVSFAGGIPSSHGHTCTSASATSSRIFAAKAARISI